MGLSSKSSKEFANVRPATTRLDQHGCVYVDVPLVSGAKRIGRISAEAGADDLRYRHRQRRGRCHGTGGDPCAGQPRRVQAAGGDGDEGQSVRGTLCGLAEHVLRPARHSHRHGAQRDGSAGRQVYSEVGHGPRRRQAAVSAPIDQWRRRSGGRGPAAEDAGGAAGRIGRCGPGGLLDEPGSASRFASRCGFGAERQATGAEEGEAAVDHGRSVHARAGQETHVRGTT